MTGLPPRDHGFDQNYFDNARQVPYDIASFPRLLSDVDYDTHAIGKMHFSPTRRSNGFDHLCLMEEIPRYLEDDDYAMFLRDNGWGQVQSVHGVRHLLYFRPQQSFVPEHLHGSSFVADRTIDAIRRNRGNRPFFIWSSFIHPHPPLDVPPRWAHLYDDADIPEAYDSITPISAQAEAIVADGVVMTWIGGAVITRDIAATLRVIAMSVATTGEAVAAAGVIDKK